MRKLAVSIAFFTLVFHGSAGAGAVVGATEFTQIANNIQLGAQYVEQVQQTIHQLNQYQAMLQNLRQLTPSALLNEAAQKLWANQGMSQTFRDLQKIVVGGQQLSYSLSSVESSFKQLYPGYGNVQNFGKSYRDWSNNTLNSVKNALSLITAHSENFSSEQGMMKELSSKSQTASGQMEVLQAGNQIGVAMVGQMQQLRQLQMAQIRSQGDFIAAQTSEKDAKKSAIDGIYDQLLKKNSSLK